MTSTSGSLEPPPVHRSPHRRPRPRDREGARLRPDPQRLRDRRWVDPDPRAAVQQAVFDVLDLSPEEQEEKFGHMLKAFRYGAPPHGGVAMGLDRLVMVLAGKDSLRDVTAFPKAQSGLDPMTGASRRADEAQLAEMGIAVIVPDEDGRRTRDELRADARGSRAAARPELRVVHHAQPGRLPAGIDHLGRRRRDPMCWSTPRSGAGKTAT